VDESVLQLRLQLAESTDKLDLADCGLTEVPPEVFRLHDLQQLALNGNQLTSLPPDIGKLTRLRKLVIAGNRLRALPPEIGALTSLEELVVHGNALEALPGTLGRLTALRILSVSGNRLRSLPESIGNLELLTELMAGGNLLESVPSTLGSLRRLEFLHLHGNRLTHLPDSLGGCAALQELYVQGNRLRSLPPGLGALSRMQEMSVADNALEEVLEDWGGLESLGLLYMYGNRLRHLPASMARMRSLRSLWIEGNPLEPQPLHGVLAQMPHVRVIGIDDQSAAVTVAPLPNVAVGRVNSDGGAAPGYFKLQPHTPGAAAEVLVVAFGSAPGVPNWGKLLDLVRASMSREDGVPFDTLFVADPFRQWYGAGAGDAAADNGRGLPSSEYRERIGSLAREYRRVLLLGDSMGATGALLCADVATAVVAFCPQVELETASIRPCYEADRFPAVFEDVAAAVGRSRGRITLHTGAWEHDEAQARLLADQPNVAVVVHPEDTHRVALALQQQGQLLPLVRAAILDEARQGS